MARLTLASLAALAALCAGAAPALAHGPDNAPPPPPMAGDHWQGHWEGGPGADYAPRYGMDEGAWHEWHERAERCRDFRPSRGTTGAVIGGVVGGVAGNRLAPGDRALGTVAGAAVGAVAGAAIEKGADENRRRECEEFWANAGPPMPMPYAGGGYPMMPPPGPMPGGYPGYGYAPYGYVWVPVMVPARQKPCVETTTTVTEYVPAVTRSRYIPRRAHPHTKLRKEKRVYTGD